MKKRVYIASCLENAVLCESVGNLLRKSGFKVESSWHDTTIDLRMLEGTLSNEERKKIASDCIKEVKNSDICLLIANKEGRGCWIELAVAWSQGKDCVIIGDRKLIPTMAYLPQIQFFDNLNEFLDSLSS